MKQILLKYNNLSLPLGICKWLPCEVFFYNNVVLIFVCIIIIVAIVFYLSERYMITATFTLFVVSCVLFAIQESNGIFARAGLLSFTFFAQSTAYFLYRKKIGSVHLQNDRILFSIQAIAAGYTLSALSKLYESGLYWVADGQYMALQVLKSFHFGYVTYNDTHYLEQGINNADFIVKNTTLILILLSGSLILELFSVMAVLGKKNAIIYGGLLLCMHIGIYIVMDILIRPIIVPMIVFMLNPFYLIWLLFDSSKKQIFLR